MRRIELYRYLCSSCLRWSCYICCLACRVRYHRCHFRQWTRKDHRFCHFGLRLPCRLWTRHDHCWCDFKYKRVSLHFTISDFHWLILSTVAPGNMSFLFLLVFPYSLLLAVCSPYLRSLQKNTTETDKSTGWAHSSSLLVWVCSVSHSLRVVWSRRGGEHPVRHHITQLCDWHLIFSQIFLSCLSFPFFWSYFTVSGSTSSKRRPLSLHFQG